MAIPKSSSNVPKAADGKNAADGQEKAVDPGTPETAAAEGEEAVEEYKEETGDPTGTARNSAEAGVAATAKAMGASVGDSPEAEEAKRRANEEVHARAVKEAVKEGAVSVKRKPRNARLKAVKYEITDPFNGVRVTFAGTANKVEVTNWMQAQIDSGLVLEVED